jgi:hypothetical protein
MRLTLITLKPKALMLHLIMDHQIIRRCVPFMANFAENFALFIRKVTEVPRFLCTPLDLIVLVQNPDVFFCFAAGATLSFVVFQFVHEGETVAAIGAGNWRGFAVVFEEM